MHAGIYRRHLPHRQVRQADSPWPLRRVGGREVRGLTRLALRLATDHRPAHQDRQAGPAHRCRAAQELGRQSYRRPSDSTDRRSSKGGVDCQPPLSGKRSGNPSLFKDLSDQETGQDCPVQPRDDLRDRRCPVPRGRLGRQFTCRPQGTVAVEVGLLGRQRRRCATIATARRGESVGWSAGVGSEKYLASAYAVEKTIAVAVDGKPSGISSRRIPLQGFA